MSAQLGGTANRTTAFHGGQLPGSRRGVMSISEANTEIAKVGRRPAWQGMRESSVGRMRVSGAALCRVMGVRVPVVRAGSCGWRRSGA